MPEAGIRDLGDHLSRYLERVQAGEQFTVTDQGRPIARLIAVDEPGAFERLVAEGLVTPAATRGRHRPKNRVAATSIDDHDL